MSFLERFGIRQPVDRAGISGSVLPLEKTEEELAAIERSNEEFFARKERERNERLEKRILLLKEIDPVIRGIFKEINATYLNNLGEVTVEREIDDRSRPEDMLEAMFNEHFIEKILTYYAIEWRDADTGYNGLCITVRINNDELAEENPILTLNTEQLWIGYQVVSLKDKNWTEKLRKEIISAVERGKTRGWRKIIKKEERVVRRATKRPVRKFLDVEPKEQQQRFPEKCTSCGAAVGKAVLEKAYRTHSEVVECLHCGTSMHRLA